MDKLPVEGSTETREPDEQDVVVNGVIVGRDPDPNVRANIRRDKERGNTDSGN